MEVYRTAFKIGDEWLVTGLTFPSREEAEHRAARCRQNRPHREVIVVCIPDMTPDNPEK